MSSPRISKDMREKIVKNAIDERFAKARKELKDIEERLFEDCYNEAYPKPLQKKLQELGEEFICKNDSFVMPFTNVKISHSVDHLTARNTSFHLFRRGWVPSDALRDRSLEFDAKKGELRSEIMKAEATLMGVLESVTTFKKLRAVWPNGAKFYDMYDVDHTVKPKVPALVISDLNKIFKV